MIIMKGLPASGKSTLAKQLMSEQGNLMRINKDLLRTMLHFDKFNGRNEGFTRDVAKVLAEHFLSRDINVIIDDTNLNPKTTQGWVGLAKLKSAKIEYKEPDTSVEECIERDSKREKKVGKTVIQKMALQYKDYLKGQKVIICDLDGTLCNIDHRLHFVKSFKEGEKKDWKGFFNAIPGDTSRQDVIEKMSEYFQANSDIKLIFVSARPEDYREATEEWLDKNYPWSDYEALIMRESHDSRDDTEVKSDIYEKYLKNLKIVKVFDDRPKVIRMWREKGLEVEDVGPGFEF